MSNDYFTRTDLSEQELEVLRHNLQTLAEKYNMVFEETRRKIHYKARDTQGIWVTWFYYDKHKAAFYVDSTDYWNIWLCDTRKDFTPEVCIQFVKDANMAMGTHYRLREFIDPEDWQVLANVCDAYQDERYINN